MDTDPLILSPAIALHQDGQVHTVEFRVRSWGDLLDAAQRVVGVTLMDGPADFTRPEERDLATVLVLVPAGLADQYRSETGSDLGLYLMGKLVRVRGTIRREKLSAESIDGSRVQHARVRIDLTDLAQIEVVSADRTSDGPLTF